MTEVKIPFMARFEKPMLNFTKTWTSRTRVMGNIGDTFEAFGAEFVIDAVFQARLMTSACHYIQEGCESYNDFVNVWNLIHPRKKFNAETLVWVHTFFMLPKEVKK